MASRKLVRDFLFSKQMSVLHFRPQQAPLNPQLRMACLNGYSNLRCFSVFNEFSKKVKGEASSNQDFQQSMKELKEKAEERAEALKEVKEDLKIRTKQTTEQLYKQVDGVWTEAEAAAKKVSADMKEKIAAATDEVKEKLGLGKQDSPGSTCGPTDSGTDAKDGNRAASASENSEDSESFNVKKATGASDTLFGRLRSGFSSSSPKVSMAFQRFKDTKVIDFAKKGYDIVKDEFSSNPNKRRRIKYADAAAAAAAASPKEGTSSKTDMVVVPTKQSRWSKKWEAVKEKMQGHPLFKRLSGYSEPVVTKGQELAEDMRERWETSDNPVVHKIQDWNETVFGETAAALSFKEIRRRDPSFSLPEFVAEVQEMIRPTLNAYLKGDVEALKKNCSPEVIERCRAEHRAYESQGIFFDNKILHISDVEVRETKLMGTSPIIIVAFQTQQVYCVRDRYGSITEGGKDTIHTVYYAWAMQQIDVEELGEGAFFPIWRLREMQQLGIQALI